MNTAKLERWCWALLLFLFGVLAGVVMTWSEPLPADASCGSIPYVFVNSSSVVDATTTNANNNFLLGCATQVDNTQIGAAGIFASQIIPNSATTAKFSGSYGWTITVTASAQVPLTIQQPSSPTADAFDIYNNALSTKYVWVDSSGVLHTNQAPVLNGTTFDPTVFVNLSGTQTISGAKTFSTAPTLSGANITTGTIPNSALATAPVTGVGASGNLSSTGGTTPTISETSSPSYTSVTAGVLSATGEVDITGNGTTGNWLHFQDTTNTGTAPNKYIRANGSNGHLEFINSAYTAVIANLDDSGNITATNFFTGSRRAWKINVRPYSFDALNLVRYGVTYREYDCRDQRCGPTGEHKVGIIADTTNPIIAGPYHDHYDGLTMAAVDGKAIAELANKVDGLERMVRGLCSLKQNRKVKACSSVR